MGEETHRTLLVRVLFLGGIRGVVGRKEDSVLLPREHASVGRLLEVLCRRYGRDFEEMVTFEEHSSPAVTILVNDRSVTNKRDLEERLLDDAELRIMFVTQMSGGMGGLTLRRCPSPRD